MERISAVEPPFSSALAAAFQKAMGDSGVPPIRLFRTVANNERVFCALVNGGLLARTGLLDLGQMNSGDRELVILRTTALAEAAYEWEIHVAFFSGSSGLTEEQIHDTTAARVDASLWTARQKAIISLVDAAVLGFSQETIIDGVLSDEEIIEIIMLAGLYRTVSCLVHASGVEREQTGVQFPGWRPA